jgi:GNAT superfamily N-acetyltransferase
MLPHFTVDEEFQGLGVGGQLFEEVRTWAVEHRAQWLLVLSAMAADEVDNWWCHQLEKHGRLFDMTYSEHRQVSTV